MYSNYYNPFTYQAFKPKGFKSLINSLKKINVSTILTNTSKTLNVINQAIPIYYQVKPLIKNAKTIFKVANEIKKDDLPNNKSTNSISNSNYNYGNPKFFA